MKRSQLKPTVLTFSGLDPTGSAGLQADIESIAAQDAHAIPILTCLTVQNTSDVYNIEPVKPDFIYKMAKKVIADMPIGAVKIGLLPNYKTVEIIIDILENNLTENVSVVLDPIIKSSAGTPLCDKKTIKSIVEMFHFTSLVTPNTIEAREFGNNSDIDCCAKQILKTGASSVLVTGTHEKTSNVQHKLYTHGQTELFEYKRLKKEFHGSGCTMAAAAAAQLSKGEDITSAVKMSLDYTWDTLNQAFEIGRGQSTPTRIFK